MKGYFLAIDYSLWIVSFVCLLAGCWVALRRKDFYANWRVFTFYLCFMAVHSLVLLAISLSLGPASKTYRLSFYGLDFLEAILLNLVVLEILVKMLDGFDSLPGRTVARFCFWAVLGVSISVGISVALPQHTSNVAYDLPLTIERTIYLADAALLWVLLIQSKALGITWRSCQAEIATGFILYLTVQSTTRFVVATYRTGTLVSISSEVGQLAYLVALIGWIWTILHRDPRPAHPSPESLAKLQELADEFNSVPKERIFAAVGVKIQRPDAEEQDSLEQEPQTS